MMLKGSAKWPCLSLSQRKGEIMKVVVPGDRVYQKMQEKKIRLMSKFWNMIRKKLCSFFTGKNRRIWREKSFARFEGG